MDDHFRVRLGLEAVPASKQLLTQFDVIVDLTVEDDPDGAVLVAQRLVPTAQVDDRQTAHGHAERTLDVYPFVVGPAMRDERRHSVEESAVGRRPIAVVLTGDAPHVSGPTPSAREPARDQAR